MLLALAALLALGSGIDPPDVKNFNVVLSTELKFQVDDYKTGLVGRVVVYQNPDDSGEFVKVYYRQVAIVSERAQSQSITGAGSIDANLSNLKYHSQEEKETLARVQKATDAFAYVQWRVVRDLRTGQDIRDGPLRSWLLESNGNWTFSNAYGLVTSPFSESSKDNPNKRIIVGIRFSLVGGVHIVRVDQDDISVLIKEATNEKK
jgi:hypothetical protein